MPDVAAMPGGPVGLDRITSSTRHIGLSNSTWCRVVRNQGLVEHFNTSTAAARFELVRSSAAPSWRPRPYFLKKISSSVSSLSPIDSLKQSYHFSGVLKSWKATLL